MKKFYFSLLYIFALITSCNMQENEIADTTDSGVVLIQNRSYYEVVLSNGESIYFKGFDKDGDLEGLAMNEDSVEVSTSFGTGFFISETGQIATNAHVVSNTAADKEVNKSVSKVFDGLKALTALAYSKKKDELDETQEVYDYARTSNDVSYETFYKVKLYRDGIQKELEELRDLYNAIDDINPKESEIKYHNEVSVAYNNTYVTNMNDFASCVIKKIDPEHDLAIIQLKSKKTPTDNYIFQIPEVDPLEEYSFFENLASMFSDDKNSRLFMNSFNLGPSLALTDEGIKSQFNNGTISQKTEDKLMYSIPALPGSSGSPVVNYRAQLVAINFAGLNTTQNFNYGIRVKHLRKLMNE